MCDGPCASLPLCILNTQELADQRASAQLTSPRSPINGPKRVVAAACARDEVGVEVTHDDERAVDATSLRSEMHREIVDEQPLRPLGLHQSGLRRLRVALPSRCRHSERGRHNASIEHLRVVLTRRVARLAGSVRKVRLDYNHRLLGGTTVDAAEVPFLALAVVDAPLRAPMRLFASPSEPSSTPPRHTSFAVLWKQAAPEVRPTSDLDRAAS